MQFGVEPQRHDVEPVARAVPGERVEGERAGQPGEVDGEQVRADRAAVHPRHERRAVAADAARVVVEHLTAPERPSEHVRLIDEQRAQAVDDHVDRVHHHRHVRLPTSSNTLVHATLRPFPRSPPRCRNQRRVTTGQSDTRRQLRIASAVDARRGLSEALVSATQHLGCF